MSIAAKLTELNNIKEDIKSAIISKGVSVDNEFSTYADKIRLIGEDIHSNPFTLMGYNSGEEDDYLNYYIEQAQEFINKWDASVTSKSFMNNSSIKFFPVVDTSNFTTMANMFKDSSIEIIGLIDTSNVTDMNSMFYGCTELVSVPNWDVRNVTDMSNMFYGCTKLLAIHFTNTDSVTNMYNMFWNSDLKEFPTLNTAAVTNMSHMFYECANLTLANVHLYDTSLVTNMSHMFYYCSNLEHISFVGCDLTKVADWTSIVDYCDNLSYIDFSNAKISDGFKFSTFNKADNIYYTGLDTSALTNALYLFSGVKFSDCSNIDFSNVTDMSYMFYSNTSTSIDLKGLDTSNVTKMNYTFAYCSNLDVLDLSGLDISKVTSIVYMLGECTTNVLILDGWDFSSVSSNTSWISAQSSKSVSLKNVIAKGDFTCPYASESIDLTGIDTTACTSFILESCGASAIDLSSVDTSNFTSMDNMFSGCSNITSLDISHFNTSNVTTMNSMFFSCSSLTSIDLSNLLLDSVTDMRYMFWGCNNLSEVKMTGNPASLTYCSNMFSYVADNGTFYYNPEYDYSNILAVLPSTWTAVEL